MKLIPIGWKPFGEALFNLEYIIKVVQVGEELHLELANYGREIFTGEEAKALWEYLQAQREVNLTP